MSVAPDTLDTMATTREMRTFGHLLVNTAVANLTTSFLWFALVFWVYIETRSVLATGLIGGAYMLFVAIGSIVFGTIVDHRPKLTVMKLSSIFTLGAFVVATGLYASLSTDELLDLSLPWFWLFTSVILAGAVVEHMRNIALSTSVTILVPDERRANANGLVGTVQGIAIIVTSVFSGLSIGYLGMGWTMVIAVALTGIALLHLFVLTFPPETLAPEATGLRDAIDLRGSLAVIAGATGLMALIIFSTFNNFIGGVYMALMDPYALELMSVQAWGLSFALASTGFIIGGILVARFGLGANPMRTMLMVVAAMGVVGAVFTIRESIWLFIGGTWLYLILIPPVESAEQTVIQRVVPLERQGRVFGFAMAFEAAAAPITAFVVAPLAEFWIIPWTQGEGRDVVEPFLGGGETRGLALIMTIAGLVMLVAALLAFLTPAYQHISRTYAASVPPPQDDAASPSTGTDTSSVREMSAEGV